MTEAEEKIVLKPRDYQLELFDYICKRNGIIHLPTGAGKTFIAIMALKHFSSQMQETISNGGKRAIFMCNTVELARQQYKNIKKSTNLKVGLYIGERDIDNWKRKQWETEIEGNQVLVGTAQVFLDIVNQNLLKITNLSIVIIDECHHATGNHPMHAFLSAFQTCKQSELPRIVGLTGVLIKGNKLGTVIDELKKLEATFRGNIITISNINQMRNVMVYSTNPNEQVVAYNSQTHIFRVETEVKKLVDELCAVIGNWDIGQIGLKMSKNLGSTREPNKKNAIKNLLSDFLYQMNDLGLYPASIAIMSPIIEFEIKKRQSETIQLRNLYRLAIQYCERIRHIIVNELKSIADDDVNNDNKWQCLETIMNYCKPKMLALFMHIEEMFKNKEPDEISCLVFVERRYTAKCVFYVLKQYLSFKENLRNHIRPQFMVGRNNVLYSIESILETKWNKTAIEEFRSKACNLLICSSVLEEGIDVQACNYVFAFDPLKTFNSYIQTKGRARSKNAYYSIFTSSIERMDTILKIRNYKDVHEKIQQFLRTRVLDQDGPDEDEIAQQFIDIIPPYIISSGARLTANSALALLHRYCQNLPWDSFGSSQPWYTKLPNNSKGQIAVSVKLPLQSSVREIIYGDYFGSSKEAKISAAFKACIRLYENGELNEFLLPITKSECITKLADDLFKHWKKYKDDITKQTIGKQMKRAYNRKCPNEFQSSLPRLGEKSFAYLIKFTTDFVENEYNEHIKKYLGSKATYALLLNKKLPKLAKMPLFMTQGNLHVDISEEPIECVIADQDQLNLLKRYHTVIFKDILRLWKEFLVVDQRNEENSYLIVPMDELPSIDWQLVKKFQHLEKLRSYSASERQSAKYYPKDYLNKVVTKWYNEHQYEDFVVTKVREDLTPLSNFNDKNYGSYADFYSSRYNLDIINKTQFLLEVRSLTHRRNFFNNASNKSTEKKREQNTIILIPELCHNYKYPADLWLKALFLPTILHRVYYMLHAETLRQRINKFLNLDKYFTDYSPKPLIIDTSLKRVLDDDGNLIKEKERPKKVLPSLPTQKSDIYTVHSLDSLNRDEGKWKQFLEPIDLTRNLDKTFPVEIDYYYKFLTNLIPEISKLKIRDDEEYSKLQFDIPNTSTSNSNQIPIVNMSKKVELLAIKDSITEEKLEIEMLKRIYEKDECLKSAEQYEFLAAITSARVNDVFDMERYELLGDAFLKFSVSLYLANKYPTWHEGFLSIIKGRMVSNRNLLYCLMETNICEMICATTFNPNADWVAPLSSLPANLLNLLKSNLPTTSILSPCDFYTLQLTQDEINSGICAPEKLECFIQSCKRSQELAAGNIEIDPENDINIFLYKDVIRDKVVADTLEALMGVCVKNYGIQRSFKMLDFFGICKSDNNSSHINLLDLQLSGSQLRANISQKEVNGFLINCEFLEKNLGYKFRDRAFLLQALTHPSYPTNRLTGCYQELEFIGDAILDMLITCYIFERNQNMTPGQMTDLRMALVNNITLGCVCVRYRFHLFLLYENAALAEAIKTFDDFQETQNYRVTDQVRILMEENLNDNINPFNDNILNDTSSSDNDNEDNNELDIDMEDCQETAQQTERNISTNCWPLPKKTYNMAKNVDVPKALGDIVEALIAAVYLDCRDLKTTWKVIYNLMQIELEQFSSKVPIDPVRQLGEVKQAHPKYSKPVIDNTDVMVTCVFNCLDKTYTTNGFGCNAIQAKKAAAKQALQILAKLSN